MKKTSLILLGLGLVLCLYGQEYTSFFTGSTTDLQTTPSGGICLMGGGTESDNAMRWFLEGASGGDILVIRASGSDGYNDYLYTDLGIHVNSVETIRFNSPEAANNAYIRDKIDKAEAIWIAGGDQWDYVSYWRDTPIAAAINTAINQRNIMIGGTSAGMAILGGAYFSAQNGTVTSEEAIANPYNSSMTVDNTPFMTVSFLNNVITDTHYDDRDRRGRHIAFLAKASTDFNQPYLGIACNESTAICITPEGIASIYGTFPDYPDYAYFLIPNCAITANQPEQCVAAQPLIWDQNAEAIKVYAVKGTPTGIYTFNLNDWDNGEGGDWENWSISNGQVVVDASTAPNCMPLATHSTPINYNIKLLPNPTNGNYFSIDLPVDDYFSVRLYDLSGRLLNQWDRLHGQSQLSWHFSSNGVYTLEIHSQKYGRGVFQLVVK